MKIKLGKKSPQRSYIGKNEVSVRCADCFKYKCFWPHNWQYTESNGRIVNDYRCNTRENRGCPDVPEKITE